MKLTKLFTALCLALTLGGCNMVNDDISKCVWDENATLTFHYLADDGTDLFPANISSVDAFIFDVQNVLVAYRHFDQAALDDFRGWKLTLPAGDYRALCWADIDDNSCFSSFTPGVTTLEQCTVQIDAAATATGDHVFYAPKKAHPQSRAAASYGFAGTRAPGDAIDYSEYSFSIPAWKSVVKQMHFTRAHRTLNVYVQGFSDGGQPPIIEVSNLWGQYDFMYNTLDSKFNFTQAAHTVTTVDGPMTLSTFYFAFGEVLDDMVITIRKPSDNSIVYTVSLRDFLDDNPTADKNDIDLVIRFFDMGVDVIMPDWNERPVTPGGNY